MFNKDFYPTPKRVIRKMIQPYITRYRSVDEDGQCITDMTILEPSAGKGDIADYIREAFETYHGRSRVDKEKLYCIERDPELRMILQKKGYKVIADDFLWYNGDYQFDLIVMNPPFSNGDAHLLKAWEILGTGDIVCLLNSETLRNPHTERRQLLSKIIADNNGKVEEIGSVFTDAERKTNVEVSIVRLSKQTESKFDFKFESVTKETKYNLDEGTLKNPVARQDVIGNLILQYDNLKQRYIEYLKANDAMEFYAQGIFRGEGASAGKTFNEVLTEQSGTNKEKYNGFCDDVKQQVWSVILDKVNIQKYMTYGVRQNFAEFAKNQGCMDLTKENVESLIQMIIENSYTILDKAVIDVFDMFTKYHSENRLHVEGWKTNDKWKVNKKVILPYFVTGGYNGFYDTSSRRWNEYSDIDKVMCYLAGKNYDDMATRHEYNVGKHEVKYKILGLQAAIQRTQYGDSSLQECEFFKFRCYKKGTLHIEFKDKFLWQEFNMRACAGKMWLPESEKRDWENKKQNSPESGTLLQLTM